MSKRLAKSLTEYTCCAVAVGLLAWVYLSQRDFAGAALVDKYRMLCDAFTIPGMTLLMIGLLSWVASQGALDGLTYCVRFAIFSLIPGKRVDRDEKYVDYVLRKREKRKEGKGFAFLFHSGLVTMAVALVFMALFYSLYQK